MNNYVLECRSLSRHFVLGSEKLKVLDAIDLRIAEGEMLSITGSSGSGKTTLLNILAGLDMTTEGEVLINGISYAELSDAKRAALRNQHLGFVFQFHHLLQEFTALENVLMPIAIRGGVNQQWMDKARDLLSQMGMAERKEHKPAELSGGERQRVAIARALINDPSIVLMDEPTGNLDERTSEHIQGLLLDLNRQHKASFVIVTHSQELAQLTPKRLHLQKGRLSEA